MPFAFTAMASPCMLRLAGAGEEACRQAAALAIAEVQRIERAYSRYRPDSIVSRINAAAGRDWVTCDEETLALFGYADALHAASGGLFDITSGILRRAWDFRVARVPSPQELAPLLGLIGWHRAERDGDRVRLPRAGMEIDFGGFGKEYAADRAAAVLQAHGIGHGYVDLGGDLRVIGPRPDGSPWYIGIQNPRDADALAASIPLARGGLATSGDYERYIEVDGRRHCHILDPRTGMPVSHWRSVSVLAPLAVVAGSHATIAMLLQERGREYLDAAGVAYLAIDHAGRIVHHPLFPHAGTDPCAPAGAQTGAPRA